MEVLTNKIPEDSDLTIVQCSLIRHNLEIHFLKRIRQETNSKICLIGPFVSVRPKLFLEYADLIIQGEPESVAFRINKNDSFKGIIKAEPIMDLDSLPFPDWSVFPLEEFTYSPSILSKPFTFIQSSRGCVYFCNYCPYKVFGLYRERSVKNVIEEMEHLQEAYNIKGLMFRDPCFSVNSKRVANIAKEIINKGIKIEWGCETRLDHLEPDLLSLLYDSGLRTIVVGIESSNPEILEHHKRKPIEIDHQENIVKFCDKKGIRVVALYIIGLENDTKESVLNTIEYAKKLNTDFANFTICTPIPGTVFYEQVKNRIFEKDWEKFDNFHPVSSHKNFTPEELLDLNEKAVVSYYIRPRFILKHILRKLR